MIHRFLIAAFAVPALAASPCTPVRGDRILGRDLKAASRGFDSLADDAVIGHSPAPGARRVFSLRELARFGSCDRELCFERETRPVPIEAFETALRAALAGRDVRLEIVDYPRTPLPAGTLEFTLAGLAHPASPGGHQPALWRGRMRYGEHRSVPVSVVVRISEQRRWIESAALLAAGKPVRETDLAVKSGLRFALSPSPPADPGQFAGRLPRRNIPSGATLVPSMFADALIARGETVSVEVSSGAVSLRFEGRAESGGRADDRILVLDPARGLRIKAKVVASGKVLVDADQNRTHAALRAAGDSGGGLE